MITILPMLKKNRGGWQRFMLKCVDGSCHTITARSSNVSYKNIIANGNFPMPSIKIINYEKISNRRCEDCETSHGK